jgi:hypothetical protein
LLDLKNQCEDPFTCSQSGFLSIPHITPRIVNQAGLFSIQADITQNFEALYEKNSQWIYKIIIPTRFKKR